MVALLKQKSKVTLQQKSRKLFKAKDIFKRLKTEDGSMQNVTFRPQSSQ